MKMLYRNDSTHEETLVEVRLDEIGLANNKYREGVQPYIAEYPGIHKTLTCGSRDINVEVSQDVVLYGRAGCGVILTDEQEAQLVALDASRRAENAAKRVSADWLGLPRANGPSIANGGCCYSCGHVRKSRRGDCPFCGADAL